MGSGGYFLRVSEKENYRHLFLTIILRLIDKTIPHI